VNLLKILQQFFPLRGKETVTLTWSNARVPESAGEIAGVFQTTFELIVSNPTTEKKIAHVIVGIYE
jgi:hypothetical protein